MGVNNIPNKEYGSMSNSKIYQVNYHDGDGWQAIDEAAIKQRVGQSWDYLCWCFERGETAAVRHVEYRLVSGEQICIKVTRKGGLFYYARYQGEISDVLDLPITRDRAIQLVELNPGGEMKMDEAKGGNQPPFSDTYLEWVYTAVMQPELEGAE